MQNADFDAGNLETISTDRLECIRSLFVSQ